MIGGVRAETPRRQQAAERAQRSGRGLAVGLLVLLVGSGIYAPAKAADSAAKPTGELRFAMAGIGNMRPIPWQETVFGKGYMVLLYDFLVGGKADGTPSADNGVAERWEMSEDAKTWTFYLRKGIRFHDGTELTAEDAKWSLDNVLKPESVAAFASRLRDAIQDIKVVDPYTLVIQAKSPAIFMAQDLSMATGYEGAILPKAYFEQVGADGFAAKAMGSGPYKWVKGAAGSLIQLEAVDKHWAEGVPKFKTVTYRVVPEESTRIAMLQTGEVDIAGVSRERVPDLQAMGFKVFVKEQGSVMGCYFHQQWEDVPVADKRVREALNLAINREELVKFIFAGQAKPVAMYPIGSFAVTAGADTNLKPYPYNPERAKQLLQEAGHPNGFETTIYSYAREDVPEMARMVEAIAGYAAKIGVKMQIFATEYTVARTKRMTGKMPGHISCLGTPNRSGAGDLLALLFNLHHSSSKFTDHKAPELDALFTKATTATQLDEVKQALGAMHRWLYDDYATMPIAEVSTPYVGDAKKVPQWDLGRTLYDNNDRDVVRRR